MPAGCAKFSSDLCGLWCLPLSQSHLWLLHSLLLPAVAVACFHLWLLFLHFSLSLFVLVCFVLIYCLGFFSGHVLVIWDHLYFPYLGELLETCTYQTQHIISIYLYIYTCNMCIYSIHMPYEERLKQSWCFTLFKTSDHLACWEFLCSSWAWQKLLELRTLDVDFFGVWGKVVWVLLQQQGRKVPLSSFQTFWLSRIGRSDGQCVCSTRNPSLSAC